MRLSLASVSGGWLVTTCALALSGAACVSPDTFARGDDAGAGAAGQSGAGSGGNGTASGMGGSGQGGSGQGGSGQGGAKTGGGGMTGAGGRTGMGGSGMGGTVVVGPGANFTEDFENAALVGSHWLAPQSNDSTPCGTWALVAEGTNHIYQQSANCSNASFAAGGSTDWVDMRLQARVRFPTGSTATVISIAVRYNSPKDLYWIEYTNNGGMKIRTRTSTGSTTDVAVLTSAMRVPVPDGQWVTLGLGVSGTTVTAYLGDNRAAAPVLTATAAGQTKGGIAIGSSKGLASFDDVLVTPP
jgi:hypothetical protein